MLNFGQEIPQFAYAFANQLDYRILPLPMCFYSLASWVVGGIVCFSFALAIGLKCFYFLMARLVFLSVDVFSLGCKLICNISFFIISLDTKIMPIT